ncbi:MAG: hypothetical protein M0Z42_07615 [Actinomycetota bacterium]|nr:hypothetical protein [Actinomycetota bacterium]
MLPCEVRVTSPVHPLFGRLLSATGFKRRGGTLLLVVGLPDGAPGTIPASATDVLGGAAPEGGQTLLSIEGVRQLRVLVEALRQPMRVPPRPETRK